MNKLTAFLRLIRIFNLLFIALVMILMELLVVGGVLSPYGFHLGVMPWWMLLLSILATMLIAGGAYALNDYFDAKIDAINRPERQVVGPILTRQNAMRTYQIMSVIGALCGIAVAWACQNLSVAIIYIFVPGLLWFYSASYKRQFIIGNLIIAIAAGLAPLLVALIDVSYLQHTYADLLHFTPLTRIIYTWVGGFAVFAVLCTWIREIVKDMQDQVGDREMECHTLPIVLGNLLTKIITITLVLITCALIAYCVWSILPFPHEWNSPVVRFAVFGLFVPFACEIWMLIAAKIPSDYRGAQLLLKLIMMIGVMFSALIYAAFAA